MEILKDKKQTNKKTTKEKRFVFSRNISKNNKKTRKKERKMNQNTLVLFLFVKIQCKKN